MDEALDAISKDRINEFLVDNYSQNTDAALDQSGHPPPLPPEIFSEIYLMACHLEPDETQPRTCPLFLGKICRSWREIAWSTPRLWQRIDLSLMPSTYSTQVVLLADWLTRAKKCPLTISLSWVGADDHWVNEPPREVMQLLVSASQYWRHATLILPSGCYEDLIPLKGSNLPLLISLNIRPPFNDCSRQDLVAFLHSPLLCNVQLQQFYFQDVYLPWQQLTTCNIKEFFLDETFDILRCCHNLIKFQVTAIVQDNGSRGFIGETITHSYLQSLEICNTEGDDISVLLCNVLLPALLNLNLHCADSPLEPVSLQTLTHKSSYSLNQLYLRDPRMLEVDLINCLWMIPSLVKIRIAQTHNGGHYGLSSASLDAFCNGRRDLPAGKIFLPNVADFRYEGGISFSGRNLEDMLLIRWGRTFHQASPPATPLQVFHLATDYLEMDDEVEKRLQGMVEQGLRLSISVQDKIFFKDSQPA